MDFIASGWRTSGRAYREASLIRRWLCQICAPSSLQPMNMHMGGASIPSRNGGWTYKNKRKKKKEKEKDNQKENKDRQKERKTERKNASKTERQKMKTDRQI